MCLKPAWLGCCDTTVSVLARELDRSSKEICSFIAADYKWRLSFRQRWQQRWMWSWSFALAARLGGTGKLVELSQSTQTERSVSLHQSSMSCVAVWLQAPTRTAQRFGKSTRPWAKAAVDEGNPRPSKSSRMLLRCSFDCSFNGLSIGGVRKLLAIHSVRERLGGLHVTSACSWVV